MSSDYTVTGTGRCSLGLIYTFIYIIIIFIFCIFRGRPAAKRPIKICYLFELKNIN